MVATFRVFKKIAPNGKLALYLGKRDFVDQLTNVDPVDGVVTVDEDYLKHRKVFGQIIATFRYGREEDEVMGLQFVKELCMASEQIYPVPSEEKSYTLTRMQDRLLTKLGSKAFPFQFQISSNAPNSVTLQPGPDEGGAPCGVSYELKVFVGDSEEDKSHKRSTVKFGIRKIQWAPIKQGRQPCSVIRKEFLLSPGELELETTLDRQVFHQGDPITVNISIRNYSSKIVKRIRISAVQSIDICMFASGHYRATVACVDMQDGCPISPGFTLQKVVEIRPSLEYSCVKRGVAYEGQLKNNDTNLACSTLFLDQEHKDTFGIVVSYSIKVKLFLGALGGEVVAELPFILMRQRPTKKLENTDPQNVDLGVEQLKSSRENTIDTDDQLNDTEDNFIFQDFDRLKLNPGKQD
ncbi:arrestin 1 isoform X2 [Tachypleus tridentatus]|uniref:arrestin 1 isoform X2 n=1 Tax=Tachypleus tridentatus TaxID=6853 RepID=UPI003FD0EB41